MHIKELWGTISAVILLSFASVAIAGTPPPPPPEPTSTNDSQPNNSQGLATVTVSGTGVNTAGIVSGAAGNFALGGDGKAAGLDLKRFALAGKTGTAAAPGDKMWNAWGAFSRSNISYDFAPLQSSGNVNVYLAGVDYTFANNMVFGVAVARDDTDVDLHFSGGKLTGKGWTVSPYLGIPINKNLAFDATIGFGRSDIDTVVTVGGVVAGSTHNDRNMGALGLTYRDVIGAWTLSGRGAFLAVRDKLGAYTLTNGTLVPDGTVNVSQIRIVGEAAYTFESVTPFVSLAYINDVRRPDQAPVGGVAAANDSDAWTPTIGIRFKFDNSVYGGIRYSTERGRSEVKNDQFLFHLGIRF